MKTNLFDAILKHIILRVLTKDEWHTAVLGFFDGLSFENQGRWTRRTLASPKLDLANIGTEKVWYYRAPYVLGEITKIILVIGLAQFFGLDSILSLIIG
jgi:hypothetical protein